jgi:hypothetical protein
VIILCTFWLFSMCNARFSREATISEETLFEYESNDVLLMLYKMILRVHDRHHQLYHKDVNETLAGEKELPRTTWSY